MTVAGSNDAYAGLDAASWAALDSQMTTHRLTGGDVLYREGDPPDGLALIVRGQLAVLTDDERVDGTFGRGDVLGEIGAVSGMPRTRTVIATRDTELRVLDQPGFEALFTDHPTLARELSRLVAERLITEQLRPVHTHVASTVAIVRATESIDAAAVVAALERHRDRTAVVTRATLAGADDPLAVLDRIELDHDLTILDGGVVGADASWTDRCVRQADAVMVLVEAADAARPSPAVAVFGAGLREHRGVVELVVVNRAGAPEPADAGAVRRAFAPDRLHQIRAGEAASIDRAVRLVLGHGTALVLSGGGAKGYAHIGVWRAIHELGIPVDAIAGVSFGALMAWGVALDYTPDALLEAVREHLVEADGIFDFTPPLSSVLAGKGAADELSILNGERTFDETWRPLVVSSVDLATGGLVDHIEGPIWRAVRASMSIPGVFPPIRHGDRLLVDGAVRDNLPIRSTRAAHPGPLSVIAVDVGAQTDIEAGDAPEDGRVSGWRQLGAKLRVTEPVNVPSIGQVLMRVMELSGAESSGVAERTIVPRLDGYGVGDFKKLDALADLGYEAAMEALG